MKKKAIVCRTLFLDANVFFAATCSSVGASRGLFELAKHGKVHLVSSLYALNEARINILKKLGEDSIPLFFELVSILVKVDKTPLNSILAQKYHALIHPKDLPILVSALQLKVDFLITLDRKDFKTPLLQKTKLPFKILFPGECIKTL